MPLIRTLTQSQKDEYKNHLLSLEPNDRYKRFCSNYTDEAIEKYVSRIDFNKTTIMAIEDVDGNIVGCGEMYVNEKNAELAFSVLPSVQGKGLGNALMEKVVLHAKALGVENLNLVCLSENGPMKKLAQKAGMSLRSEYGETEGELKVQPATINDVLMDNFEETCGQISHFQRMIYKNAGIFIETYKKNTVEALSIALGKNKI